MKITEEKRLTLLTEGVNVATLTGDFTRGRVSVCNGIFLQDPDDPETGVKIRVTKTSPYTLLETLEGYQIRDRDDGLVVSGLQVRTNQREQKSSILKEQLSGVLATTLYGCELVNLEQACGFCSSPVYASPRFTVEEFATELLRLSEEMPVTAVTMNAGSIVTQRDKGYSQMAPYVRAARNAGVIELNLELMPNPEITGDALIIFLQQMRNDGVTSAQFNMEIWDTQRAEEIMPYKGKIPRKTYLEWLGEGSKVFGRGKTSTVILLGLNTLDQIAEAAQAVINVGAVPSIEVFRPLPGTMLAGYQPIYDTTQVVNVVRRINEKIDAAFNNRAGLEGCMKCGGCALYAKKK